MNMYMATANHSNQVYDKCSYQRTKYPIIPLPNTIPLLFQVYGKCSYQRTKYPIAKYHYVTLSITQSPIPLTLRHPFHHLKPYPLTLRHPPIPEYSPSLKVISHWQPINSSTLRPVHSRIQNISLPNISFVTLSIIQIPIPATANQRPIPVTWIWYGRRHVSVVRDRWCSQHSTHISVEYCDKYRIISVVYDCLHSRTIGYPIVMVQTLLWVMVEWSDVNVV